jgi:hypothetical protein
MLKNKLLIVCIIGGLDALLFAQSASYFVTQIEMRGMEKSLVIVDYNGQEKKVKIPAFIDGIPVRKIGPAAFKLKGISEVIIPNGIVTICDQAFCGNKLKVVVIPATVTQIAVSAFDRDTRRVMDERNIHVRTIETDMSRTTTTYNQAIDIPSDTRIYHIISDETSGQTVIQYDDGYNPLGGFDAAYRTRFHAKRGRPQGQKEDLRQSSAPVYSTPMNGNGNRTNISSQVYIENIYSADIRVEAPGTYRGAPPKINTVKSGVVEYSKVAAGNDRDYNVQKPKSISGKTENGIGRFAFSGKGLDTVVIPEGITYIAEGAFASNNLTSITIPNSVREIGSQAFMGNNLRAITIGEGVLVQLDSFRYQFSDYYKMNNYKAGTYILKAGQWNYEGHEPGYKFVVTN